MAFTSNSPDDRILIKRIEEAVDAADRRGYPHFVGFLDERQRAVAQAVLQHIKADNCLFFGGHTEAERTFLGAFPSYMEPDGTLFPLTAVAFHCRDTVRLDHRQVLGTLMSLGIKRDKVGDILCQEGLAVVFAEETIAAYLSQQITKIGGEGVSVVLGYADELPAFHSFLPLRSTIASARLDAAVKSLLGCSRADAAQMITAGLVMLNHTPTLHISEDIQAGDIVSIRGKGRFILDEIGTQTQKGRLFFSARKYT